MFHGSLTGTVIEEAESKASNCQPEPAAVQPQYNTFIVTVVTMFYFHELSRLAYLEFERFGVIWTWLIVCMDSGSATELSGGQQVVLQPQTVSVTGAVGAAGDSTWRTAQKQ